MENRDARTFLCTFFFLLQINFRKLVLSEDVFSPGWGVQLLAERLEDGLELLLGGVGGPGVDPVLDHLLAELALDVLALRAPVDGGLVGERLRAHPDQVAKAVVQVLQGTRYKTKYKWRASNSTKPRLFIIFYVNKYFFGKLFLQLCPGILYGGFEGNDLFEVKKKDCLSTKQSTGKICSQY